MATRPAASRLLVLLLVLLFLIFIQFGSAGETQLITAEPGEDAILPCEAPEKKPVIIVEWRRSDLGENDHVALYLDDQFDNEGQNPAYRNRVDLLDREMKDGDVSLVLKNVTTDDTGKYECRVDGIKNKRRKRSYLDTEPIITINLLVSAPGNKEEQKKDGGTSTELIAGVSVVVVDLFAGNKEEQKDGGNEEGHENDGGTSTGLIVGLSVPAVLVLLSVSGFLLYKKPRCSSEEQNQPPAAEVELQAMNVGNQQEPEM